MDLAIQLTPQTAVEKSIELLVKRNGDKKHCIRTTATLNAIGRTGQATGFTITKERNKIQDKRQRRILAPKTEERALKARLDVCAGSPVPQA